MSETNKTTKEAAPTPPITVRIDIRAESEEYVLAQLRDFLHTLREGGCLDGFGGGGGSYACTTSRRDITPEQYREELLAWHERLRGKKSLTDDQLRGEKAEASAQVHDLCREVER